MNVYDCAVEVPERPLLYAFVATSKSISQGNDLFSSASPPEIRQYFERVGTLLCALESHIVRLSLNR